MVMIRGRGAKGITYAHPGITHRIFLCRTNQLRYVYNLTKLVLDNIQAPISLNCMNEVPYGYVHMKLHMWNVNPYDLCWCTGVWSRHVDALGLSASLNYVLISVIWPRGIFPFISKDQGTFLSIILSIIAIDVQYIFNIYSPLLCNKLWLFFISTEMWL